MNLTESRNITVTLNSLASTIGAWSEGKGFRDDFNAADQLDGIAPDIAAALRNNVILAKVALIDTETSEAVESMRKTGYEGHLEGEGNFGEELADAMIRIFDLSNMTGVDIGAEVTAKLKVNEKRERLHGKKL